MTVAIRLDLGEPEGDQFLEGSQLSFEPLLLLRVRVNLEWFLINGIPILSIRRLYVVLPCTTRTLVHFNFFLELN